MKWLLIVAYMSGISGPPIWVPGEATIPISHANPIVVKSLHEDEAACRIEEQNVRLLAESMGSEVVTNCSPEEFDQ